MPGPARYLPSPGRGSAGLRGDAVESPRAPAGRGGHRPQMITALWGGVGGSKLVLGLYRTLPPDELTVVVNTADDLEFCGLHVSPDLDTVMYTLAGTDVEPTE